MQNYSSRLENHINNPRFLLTESEANAWKNDQKQTFSEEFEWEGESFELFIEVGASKEVKNLGILCSKLNLASGIIDAYFTLLKGKSRAQIESISWREVENYLRDQNNIPALESLDWPLKEIDINAFLVKGICMAISPKPFPIASLGNWDELNLAGRIEQAISILEEVVEPILMPEYPLELVAMEGEKLVLSCDKSISPGILSYLKEIFEECFSTSNLNLVAE